MALTWLVTGANRGIGLEFARQLSVRGERIIGTARDVEKATDLARLVHQVVALDVSDESSIHALPERLKDAAVDVLINNAGVSSEVKNLEKLSVAELQRVFMVNSFAPILVTKAVMKNLRAGTRKMVFNITSQLGSVSTNNGGSSYAYRASKSALNQLTRSMAAELKGEGFTCVAAHPGWVRTDMGGGNAPLSTEESVRSLLKTIDGLKATDTGRLLNYDGKDLAW